MIARQLRQGQVCGLLIVSGHGDPVDKLVGLEIGADDCITKPFNLRELVARMKAVARHLAPPAAVAGPGRGVLRADWPDRPGRLTSSLVRGGGGR